MEKKENITDEQREHVKEFVKTKVKNNKIQKKERCNIYYTFWTTSCLTLHHNNQILTFLNKITNE